MELQIDKLDRLRKEIKRLQDQEAVLSKEIKEILIEKGLESEMGEVSEAVLLPVEQVTIDNQKCYKIIGIENFIKIAKVTKSGLGNLVTRKQLEKISKIKTDYRLKTNLLEVE